jgi:hypothetical protein
MLYREIIAVCSESHTKHINTLCGQNVELLNVKPGGIYSDHWQLKTVNVNRTAQNRFAFKNTSTLTVHSSRIFLVLYIHNTFTY